MTQLDSITLVLRAVEGGSLEQVLPFTSLGAHVSIGRGLALIAGASEGDLQEDAALRDALLEEVLNEVPHGWGASFSESDLAGRIRVALLSSQGSRRDEASTFNIDDHIKLVADARRYRHLRDRECLEDHDNDLLVLRGDTYFIGDELDRAIDTALRLEALEQKVVLEQQP